MELSQIQWLEPPPPDPSGERHLNCFQQTIRVHYDLLRMDEEQDMRLGCYLGGGLRCGGT